MLNVNFIHFLQDEKNAALLKIGELKEALSESNTEVLSLRTSLTESENKIKELEATLFAKLEQHSSDVSFREQEVTKISEKIAALENDLEKHTKIKSRLEKELKTTVSVVWFYMLLQLSITLNNCEQSEATFTGSCYYRPPFFILFFALIQYEIKGHLGNFSMHPLQLLFPIKMGVVSNNM